MLPDGIAIVLHAFLTAIMSATSEQSYTKRGVPLQNRNVEGRLSLLFGTQHCSKVISSISACIPANQFNQNYKKHCKDNRKEAF